MMSGQISPWTPPAWLEQFLSEVATIQQQAQGLSRVPGVADLCVNLDQAVRRLRDPRARGILLVTFLGATGVGKSTLFNALIEEPAASPVSHDIRCFTKRPYVAVNPADRILLHFPEELQPVWVDAAFRGLALCDTPDINGVLAENRNLARRLVEESDLIIYVTKSERQADFDVVEEIRRWAVKKRWLFVFNRFDEVYDRQAVRAEFCRRLRELGFPADEKSVFFISAKNPHEFDFPRLHHYLRTLDGREILGDIRCDAFLGALQAAVQPHHLLPIKHAAEQLAQHIGRLEQELREIYREGLTDPTFAAALRRLMTAGTWQHLLDNSWGFSALLCWLRWRWSRVSLAYAVLRLGLSGVSLYRLVRVATRALAAVLSDYAPIWSIRQVLEARCGPRLSLVRSAVRRALEDYGLTEWLHHKPSQSREDDSHKTRSLPKLGKAPGWAGALAQIFEARPSPLVTTLKAELDRAAHLAAKRAGRWWVHALANLLPLVITGDFLFRLAEYWWQSAPYLGGPMVLPGSGFYILGATMIAAGLLPGWVLLSHRVSRSVRTADFGMIFHQTSQFPVLKPLRAAHAALRALVERCERLGELAGQFRRSLRIQAATAEDLTLFGHAEPPAEEPRSPVELPNPPSATAGRGHTQEAAPRR